MNALQQLRLLVRLVRSHEAMRIHNTIRRWYYACASLLFVLCFAWLLSASAARRLVALPVSFPGVFFFFSPVSWCAEPLEASCRDPAAEEVVGAGVPALQSAARRAARRAFFS